MAVRCSVAEAPAILRARCEKRASGESGKFVVNNRGFCRHCRSAQAVWYRSEAPIGSRGVVHRYYDPNAGQFISVDPMVGVTGQPYAYTGDDPVNAFDPLGLSKHQPKRHPKPRPRPANPPRKGHPGNSHGGGGHANCELVNLNEQCVATWGRHGALAAGSLRSGSSADDALKAARDNGIEIPADFAAWPARNGKGWNFSPSEDIGTNRNLIRIMEPTPEYPNGYWRRYNSYAQPEDVFGNPGSRPDTHFPLDENGGSNTASKDIANEILRDLGDG